MPPTRREQFELDELLSDIYRGIETLPDKSTQAINSSNSSSNNHYNSPTSFNNNNNKSQSRFNSRTYVKEYELPASSPLVKQHKQEIAALRNPPPNQQQQFNSNKQPQRSTLKRHTNTPEQAARQPQSLAAFVKATTPENKRRVRIVDHPDKLAKGYSSNEEQDDEEIVSSELQQQLKPTKVKYVNTNKLIYHQEREPDDNNRFASSNNNEQLEDQYERDSQEEEDIDGVSRVEYYHTSWLDRQLGRASKRRSSKELNERQVKEKAMIEELKRSLKNGAITLRQSFKGKRNSNKNKPSETYDDQMLTNSNNRVKESTVFGSGLATVPRNYQHKNNSNNTTHLASQKVHNYSNSNSFKDSSISATPKQTKTTPDNPITTKQDNFNYNYQPMAATATAIRKQETNSNSYSQTLPHNYQQKKAEHQLLQSHYRNDRNNFNTINSSRQVTTNNSNTMRNLNYSNGNKFGSTCSPTNNQIDLYQRQQLGDTISSIPSATEVVRSALSRSGSQVSINQLNKTINLLPTSPSPYAPSPMTPTQQLKPATPSLTPSPSPYQRHQTSDLINGNQPNSQQQQTLHGTRTIGRPPQNVEQKPFQQQQHQQQQPVYANPHASLMQHRIEQQAKQPNRNNNASIREFNELDSLLRSLGSSSTHITPGFTSKQSHPAFGGYGAAPATNQPARTTDIYAKVDKQQPLRSVGNYQAPINNMKQQPQSNYLQQHYVSNINNQTTHQPFTVDVTNKKDEICLERQNLSEFEPAVELLPSMEDYQNITKLNPVKNHYWYKPNMSRDRAINLLKDKPQGTFIVRDSTSFKGAYGLAVKVSKLPKNVLNNASLRNPNGDPSAELIRHFLIEPTANGVRLKGYANESVYSSLPNLIYQHSLTELALPCKLVIPRADIEDPNFNYKQKQFFDEFLASKEMAKHNPYDRTSPNGGYRKYPGDVLVHNEHRIIFE